MHSNLTDLSSVFLLLGVATLGTVAGTAAPSAQPVSATFIPAESTAKQHSHRESRQFALAEEDANSLDLGVPKPSGPCLSKPLHYTHIPRLGPGVQVALRRYLRFPDAAGRTVYARMLLLETDHRRLDDTGLPAEAAARRRDLPQRMIAIGHEIDPGDAAAFVPDFDVPAQMVSLVEACRYEIDLGTLKCVVQTVQ